MKTWPMVFAVGAFALALNAGAQTSAPGPQLFITWRATDSISPLNYQGKVFPGVDSQVIASVEVISGGNAVDLGSRTVYWYLDGGLVGGGTGKKTVAFNTPGYAEIMALRVEIPDYPGGAIMRTARIQVANPKVVIVAPYAGGLFSQSTVQAEAVPYFFKTSNSTKLSFLWNVNGQAVATQENPQSLTINLDAGAPGGYSLLISLTAQQNDDPLTNARANITLTKNQ